MDRLSSRIEMTEKMIMKLEDSSIEIIQSEKQREKRLKKKKREELQDLRDNNKSYCHPSPGRRRKRLQC